MSADNAHPERHIVIETLRRAAPLMGLKAPVIATLDAMLSCLAPKRNHNIVFASNATLVFRCNGISERSLRRHVQALLEMGLLARLDSANGKRFTRTDRENGMILRFGFDLSPLFHRFTEIAAFAAQSEARQSEEASLRTRIRASLQLLLRQIPDHAQALALVKVMRRKLSLCDLKTLAQTLPQAGDNRETGPELAGDKTSDLATNDGQNVRHHHKANKENIERTATVEDVGLETILTACPNTAELSPSKLETADDVIRHAQILAPMLGITQTAWIRAENRLGSLPTALTIWGIVQQQNQIGRSGAYFNAVTVGNHSHDFNPIRWIKRLARHAENAAEASIKLPADNTGARLGFA